MCSLCFTDHWARLSSPRFLSKLPGRFRPQVVHGTALAYCPTSIACVRHHGCRSHEPSHATAAPTTPCLLYSRANATRAPRRHTSTPSSPRSTLPRPSYARASHPTSFASSRRSSPTAAPASSSPKSSSPPSAMAVAPAAQQSPHLQSSSNPNDPGNRILLPQ